MHQVAFTTQNGFETRLMMEGDDGDDDDDKRNSLKFWVLIFYVCVCVWLSVVLLLFQLFINLLFCLRNLF